MTIPTQMSLHGFIATPPELHFTGGGAARFHARIGVEQWRKEPDGTFTKLDPTFHDLVMFKKPAERAYAGFRVGDSFVATGYINAYERERNGTTIPCEEFVARRVGHDSMRTRYEVDRTPSHQPHSPITNPVAQAAPAVGI